MNEIKKKIKREAEKQGGLIKTRQIEGLGLSRSYIPYLEEAGLLVKEAQGIYSIPEAEADEYKVLQSRSDKLVFSYGTALYFHHVSDRVPRKIDVTVPQGYNVSRLKASDTNLRFHYVKPEMLMLGTETVITPQGAEVTVYNLERCICDLIKNEKKVDKQLYTQAIREYFAGNYDSRKLLKMAKEIGVEQKVRTYMEVL